MVKYLTPKETAKYLAISIDLLQKWRTQGIGLQYIKLGDSTSSPIRYDIDDINSYLKSKTIKTL